MTRISQQGLLSVSMGFAMIIIVVFYNNCPLWWNPDFTDPLPCGGMGSWFHLSAAGSQNIGESRGWEETREF